MPLDSAFSLVGPVGEKPTLAYVIGTSDCGSTLLAFVLDSHPSICAVGEPPKRAIRRRGDSFVCSCGATVGECSFWQSLFGTMRAQGFAFSETNWPNDFHYLNDLANRLLAKHQPSTLRRAAQRMLAGALPAHQRRTRLACRSSVQFVRAALEQTGKRVFLETSKDLFRFEHLRKIHDWDLKVIRMVRDVRWFAYTKRRRLRARDAARQWRSYQLAADRVLEGLPSEKQTIIRYEDLCRAPVESARRLQEFLGVTEIAPPAEYDPADHHILGDGIAGRFTISTAEQWRQALSSDEQAITLKIAGDVNRRFGYL